MKSYTLSLLVFFLFPNFAFPGGGEAGNGSSYYERHIRLADQNIKKIICEISKGLIGKAGVYNGVEYSEKESHLLSKMCINHENEKIIFEFNQRKKSVLERRLNQIIFTSSVEEDQKDFFLINGEEKIAKTGSFIGDPIYFNRPMLQSMVKSERFSYSFALNKVFHEYAHHYRATTGQKYTEAEIESLSVKVEKRGIPIEKIEFSTYYGSMMARTIPNPTLDFPVTLILDSGFDIVDFSKELRMISRLQLCDNETPSRIKIRSIKFLDESIYHESFLSKYSLMRNTPFIRVFLEVNCNNQLKYNYIHFSIGIEREFEFLKGTSVIFKRKKCTIMNMNPFPHLETFTL